jgi:hypothetical protein
MLQLRRAVVGSAVVAAISVCAPGASAQSPQPSTGLPEPVHAGPDTPGPATSAPSSGAAEPPPKDPTNPTGPKSEKAVLQAKEAELTPIVPSPRDVTRPAYQLFAQTDLPVLGIGVVRLASRLRPRST